MSQRENRPDCGVETERNPLAVAFQEGDENLIPNLLMLCSAKMLCRLSQVNRYFRQECRQNIYWLERIQKEIAFEVEIPAHPQDGELKKLYHDIIFPRVGDVLEVVDTLGKWVVARVVAVLPSLVLIYFEGWGPQYMQWFHLDRDATRFRPLTGMLCCLGRRGPMTLEYYQFIVQDTQRLLFEEFDPTHSAYLSLWRTPPPQGSRQPSLYENSSFEFNCNYGVPIAIRDKRKFLDMQQQNPFIRCDEYIAKSCNPPLWLQMLKSRTDKVQGEGVLPRWREQWPIWEPAGFPLGQVLPPIQPIPASPVPEFESELINPFVFG
eukprot:TRINITY_DN12064_c0_g1::TRINITY_DN12064_c0_g1_i1::g.9715::m.9715 TRINITY_DN12064_c0_g1::TRINITY_DN12064_c0_g1_i1::g.9715  ORF type:complete len:321 (-),score=10.83,MBT/PF02820.13/0.021 TRINITY_DN12064_c0_g1_i1:27-989(-)